MFLGASTKSHASPTRGRLLGGSMAALMIAVVLSACSQVSVPTCSEFAGMHAGTGLLTELTSEQSRALSASLESRGFDGGAYNQAIGKGEVLAYCNIFDGVANANQAQPISNAH